MSFLDTLESITKGAITGVAVITVLPILGTAGTITATGLLVGSLVGGAAGLADQLAELDDD